MRYIFIYKKYNGLFKEIALINNVITKFILPALDPRVNVSDNFCDGRYLAYLRGIVIVGTRDVVDVPGTLGKIRLLYCSLECNY